MAFQYSALSWPTYPNTQAAFRSSSGAIRGVGGGNLVFCKDELKLDKGKLEILGLS